MLIARNFHFYIIYANFNLAFLILNLNHEIQLMLFRSHITSQL